jgi:hypothetical protein
MAEEEDILTANRHILSKLKFISKIQQGEKIDTKNLTLLQDSIVTKIIRTYLGDDREKTISFITDILDKSFEILFSITEKNTGKPSGYYEMISFNLVEDIKNSIQGINNLKKTYSDDRYLFCRYELLVENVELKLRDFFKKFAK